jgi:DNA-binding IclR family transcriptional regulator
VRQMIAARKTGAPLKTVAERYGISDSSVKRMLRAPASRYLMDESGASSAASNI